VHDALKRRCLYHWVGYPERRARTRDRARRGAGRRRRGFAAQVVRVRAGAAHAAICSRRRASPETLDWATRAARARHACALDPADGATTRWACSLKYQDDISRMQGTEAKRILDQIKDEIRTMSRAWVCEPDLHPRRRRTSGRRSGTAWPRTSCISPGCCARQGLRSGRGRCSMRSMRPPCRARCARATTSTGRCTPCS